MWKKIYLVLACGILVGCGNSSSKNVIDGELLLELSSQKVKDKLLKAGLDTTNLEVYGYKAYKISYMTKDEKNMDVKVSGLFVIPTEVNEKIKEDGLSMVSYGHGTIVFNNYAPTVLTKKYKYPIESAMIFSSLGGFATLQADYIGYGDSQEYYHPYVMKESLSNTSIDFMNAVKSFAQKNNIKLNDKLFITGYSEGGYTAMATLQQLEASGTPVTAAAPLAGAYDLDYEARAAFGLLDTNLIGFSASYFALTTLAYTKVYDKNMSTLINSPYAQKIESLLDGKHTGEQIENVLPSKAFGENGLLQENFVEDYQSNENNWFKVALKQNSIDNWKPNTPLHIVHCQGDDQVAYKISQNTYNNMVNNGASNVELITPDAKEAENKKWNHSQCFYPALEHTVRWFVEMRNQ